MLNTSIYGKLLSTITTNWRFGYQSANKEEAGLGANALVNDATHLPLNIYSINNIKQGSNATTIKYTLQDDMYTFTSNAYADKLQVSGQTTDIDTNTTEWHNMLLSRWFSIKLMLWQHATINAEFHLYIVKLDSVLQPENASPAASQEQMDQRKTYFGATLLRKLVTSPILPASGVNSNIKGLVNVLWHKKIVIKEQPSTMDDKIFKQVNLFRYTNRLLNYQQGAPLEDLSGNAAATADLNDNTNNLQLGTYQTGDNKGHPAEKDRIYFIITSNVPTGGGSKNHTYDINFVHKYTSIKN